MDETAQPVVIADAGRAFDCVKDASRLVVWLMLALMRVGDVKVTCATE